MYITNYLTSFNDWAYRGRWDRCIQILPGAVKWGLYIIVYKQANRVALFVVLPATFLVTIYIVYVSKQMDPFARLGTGYPVLYI